MILRSAINIEIPYYHLILNEDGYAFSPERGKIFLEQEKDYHVNVINGLFVEFLDSLEDCVLSMTDLKTPEIIDVISFKL